MKTNKIDKKRKQWRDYRKKRNIIKFFKRRFPKRENMPVEFPRSRKIKVSV